METYSDVIVTPLKRISVEGGDVLHGLKKSDREFVGFGEAYFSIVKPDVIKGWKRHNTVTLNLIVPMGAIRFVVLKQLSDCDAIFDQVIGGSDYSRVTISPGVWLGFQGVSKNNMLLNIIDQEHDPKEADNEALEKSGFKWLLA